jgi:hypothetical protein
MLAWYTFPIIFLSKPLCTCVVFEMHSYDMAFTWLFFWQGLVACQRLWGEIEMFFRRYKVSGSAPGCLCSRWQESWLLQQHHLCLKQEDVPRVAGICAPHRCTASQTCFTSMVPCSCTLTHIFKFDLGQHPIAQVDNLNITVSHQELTGLLLTRFGGVELLHLVF